MELWSLVQRFQWWCQQPLLLFPLAPRSFGSRRTWTPSGVHPYRSNPMWKAGRETYMWWWLHFRLHFYCVNQLLLLIVAEQHLKMKNVSKWCCHEIPGFLTYFDWVKCLSFLWHTLGGGICHSSISIDRNCRLVINRRKKRFVTFLGKSLMLNGNTLIFLNSCLICYYVYTHLKGYTAL